jgi:sulfonate transport system permease protein
VVDSYSGGAMKRFDRLWGVLFLIIIVGFVQFASATGQVKAIYLPAPTTVVAVLETQFQTGAVWAPFGATLLHVLAGWAAACVLGVIVGALIGQSAQARKLLGPTLDFMRPLPASALVPAAILLFGPNAGTVLLVTVFASIWPVLLNAVKGFESVDQRLVETARMLHFGAVATFWKISLPSALTDIVAGARVALAIALIVAVVSEMLTSVSGLGNNVVLAARAYNTPDLYAGIVLLGALGIASNGAMETLEARWRARMAGTS